MNKLIVYGTLMNPVFGLKFINSGYMAGDLYSLGRFPAVTRLDTDNSFFFQLAEVTESQLMELDEYEGVDIGLYRREIVKLPPSMGGTAYIYILNQELPDHAKPIIDWRLVCE